jgi:hypothetical protein
MEDTRGNKRPRPQPCEGLSTSPPPIVRDRRSSSASGGCDRGCGGRALVFGAARMHITCVVDCSRGQLVGLVRSQCCPASAPGICSGGCGRNPIDNSHACGERRTAGQLPFWREVAYSPRRSAHGGGSCPGPRKARACARAARRAKARLSYTLSRLSPPSRSSPHARPQTGRFAVPMAAP